MTLEILLTVVILGVALSMDAFSVSVTSGLTIEDLNKKRSTFIAFIFGFMQAIMPLIGYFIVELVVLILDESVGASAGIIIGHIVSWIACILLVFIGSKMLIEAIKDMKKAEDEKEKKYFSIKSILYFGFATSIDALGSGVALHAGVSDNLTVFLHVAIIFVITFCLSLVGLVLGKQINKLLKGKYEITGIIGGIILLLLAVWIILSHYLGI